MFFRRAISAKASMIIDLLAVDFAFFRFAMIIYELSETVLRARGPRGLESELGFNGGSNDRRHGDGAFRSLGVGWASSSGGGRLHRYRVIRDAK